MDGPARPRLTSPSDFQFGAVSTETIEDALLHLAQQNEQAVQEAAGRMGSFRETRIVEFVFLLAEQWCLEKSVSYQAVEILERFMVQQAEKICRQATEQLGSNGKTGSPNWRVLKEQLFNKFLLRLVSCVQLASKLSFHYKIISNITVLNFLQALGYPYTKEELLESELDVLKSLDFQINLPTPLAYVEMLLEVLGYNGCLVPAAQLHPTCLTLLDLVYLLHEPIYDSLLRASIENSTPSQLQGEKFISVKEDFMLLAVGIIAASAFIQTPQCWSQVVAHLQSITGIALESISEFSYAILTHSVGASTPGRQQQPAPPQLPARVLKAVAVSNT
ncbi:cyclin N-terminal domain-containing protein 1-like [Ochotona curzoniae]|uniref:cyclin N-terminal domain-containing protein 1-like n=1 Tax=Ochotona curzoniae TaxID=130825 RepID=UPI001B34C945|nr:cyclin N-terminal domain-containing protein 1-like [Ochotona curzoniae]XP_040856476.1 cyclin N-terminal domain-containing protein 1-like [Ochotona curzoniae]